MLTSIHYCISVIDVMIINEENMMSNDVKKRKIHMSGESKANVSVATHAELIHSNEGFAVRVRNDYGSEMIVDKNQNIVLYSRKATAQRSIKRYNNSIIWDDKMTQPSPSLLPPEDK